MRYIARQITMRAAGLALMALTAGLSLCRADVIQTTVVLPPAAGQYSLGTLCVDALNRCTVSPTVSGFSMMTHTEVGGNEVVSVAAIYTANVFTDNNDTPGAFVGILSLLGTAHFTFVGRDPSVDPLGTFTTLLTDFDFQGMLNGNTFEVKQDPARASTGTTTILETTFVSPITFTVSSSLDIFAVYSFNGGPFTPAPERVTTLETAPEPATGALSVAILSGILGIAARRRRIA